MAQPESSSGNPRLAFLPMRETIHLGEPLGHGAVGTVYRATSDELPGPLAVKMLHASVAHDQRIVDRFQREIVIMERLRHPHIVRHHGGGLMDGQFFYAMELLDRGTLKERLEQGPLPWREAADYIAQIASALQHAHNHGIIHRDLKPNNLFFADDGRLLLGDFGIAIDTRDSEAPEEPHAQGTYAYMSPEQISGEESITGKSDLYSLGCVAYEMLAGRPPFGGENFAQIWNQHLNAAPKRLSELGIECPDWLEQLIMEMLEKDPDKRPFNARSVQGRIREHLAGAG